MENLARVVNNYKIKNPQADELAITAFLKGLGYTDDQINEYFRDVDEDAVLPEKKEEDGEK